MIYRPKKSINDDPNSWSGFDNFFSFDSAPVRQYVSILYTRAPAGKIQLTYFPVGLVRWVTTSRR
jgi:hypothetical protein